METTTYTVDFTADNHYGQRVMGVKHVDLIDGYTTFADIPAVLAANTGFKNIVIIKAELKGN